MAINGVLNFKDSNGNVTAVYPVTSIENVSGLSSALAGKVDEENGKGLSHNDFTDEYKAELDGLDTVLATKANASDLASLATTVGGKADKSYVNTELAGKVDKVSGKGLSSNDFTATYKSQLDSLETSLSAKANTTYVDSELDKKVDKATGKVLSSNDYTDNEKNKLSGIAEGAEVNVQADWNQTTVTADDYIKNKPTLGTAAASNASDFATAAQGTKADNAIPSSAKGTAHGVAELDGNGLVPSSQLPSFVDDVLEYVNYSGFPVPGETGKIYVATDTNLTYRWSGSTYVEISPSLALGTTSSTAFRGDRGQTAYNHATDSSRLTTAKTSDLYKIATTAEGHVAAATPVTKKDITDLGIPAQNVTPQMFGAVADGVTDDTAAIQAALDSGIKIIIMPPGTYRTTETINIPEGCTLIGCNAILRPENEDASAILIENNDVIVEGLEITTNSNRGTNERNTSAILIMSYPTAAKHNVRIRNCYIHNIRRYAINIVSLKEDGDHYTVAQKLEHVWVENCKIDQVWVGIKQSHPFYTHIIGCDISNTVGENLTCDDGTDTCYITNCSFKNNYGGVGLIGADDATKVFITSCYFKGLNKTSDLQNGITFNRHTGTCEHVNITNCIFSTLNRGVWCRRSDETYQYEGINSLSVTGCEFVAISTAFKIEYIGSNNVISGNRFTTAGITVFDIDADQLKHTITGVKSDVPIEIPLSECVQEGFELSGASSANMAYISSNNIFITASFFHANKEAGDTPFILPISIKNNVDYHMQDGCGVALRTNGYVQVYGDYVNMDDEDLVEFSHNFPRT